MFVDQLGACLDGILTFTPTLISLYDHSKCRIGVTELEFLGHKVIQDGIQPLLPLFLDPEEVEYHPELPCDQGNQSYI